ncbi:MAG: hypothetical protein OJF59_001861 [Cytophagales bacterium]|jgi:hypothetical protein|nr:hypothetical protein [Bacteroidota bacterium]MBS1980769.1 hypothetical protein [Bacteroidota bacterium]WHZ08108.1 MAG: hypothetical protein OJF59_001861 [Cytophagales bacterium]
MNFFLMLAMVLFLMLPCCAQSDHLIAQEMVGKWCYISETAATDNNHSNSCITLQADGSYEAVLDRSSFANGTPFPISQDADRGTWWVKDNRLFYNSDSNGESSFAFQKQNHPRNESIPLIIVNGIMFATASAHEPW